MNRNQSNQKIKYRMDERERERDFDEKSNLL
jgi:hypothetical protein